MEGSQTVNVALLCMLLLPWHSRTEQAQALQLQTYNYGQESNDVNHRQDSKDVEYTTGCVVLWGFVKA